MTPGRSSPAAPNRMSFIASHLEGGESAVDRVIAAGDKRRRVGTEEECQLGDLVGLSHPADRLRPRELLENLGLASGIVPGQEAVDERRVHPRGGDAVAADL